MRKKALIIGSGLGGLATALRLTSKGYQVEIVEKYHQPGGRLNLMEREGFSFDTGPSFFSMTYEFDELFQSCGVKNPLEYTELNPLYRVFFSGSSKHFDIYKDIERLAKEFETLEPHFNERMQAYLKTAGAFFHDTENVVVKRNFNGRLDYLLQLMRVPARHVPSLLDTMWGKLEKHFQSEEAKIIFSLVAFFLGSTPFQTPAIYSLLNYTELRHNGYWILKGGMYEIVRQMRSLLLDRGVQFHYNTEIVEFENLNGSISSFVDNTGKRWNADVFVVNSDAAKFRGSVLGRKNFSTQQLDKMEWTMAPFTIYLGVNKKLPGLLHHNYFLGENFREYARTIFTSTESPKKPYYYVNVGSYSDTACAPPGCENLFIVCPVPDLRFKKDWVDKDAFAKNILDDLSSRIGVNLEKHTLVQEVWTPENWQQNFNLHRGSGLGLAHGLMQVGGFRPSNKDELFSNLFYVGASTTPGTGLPMVVISSKLVTERILSNG